MLFPNCRNDESYNEDFLRERDKDFTLGFDWCTANAVDNFFENLDVYFEGDSHITHLLNEELPKDMQGKFSTHDYSNGFDEKAREHELITYGDLLRCKILDHIEMERDELLTSMIDNMDEEEYEKLKEKALKNNKKRKQPKKYYDTRKFMVTGKIVSNQDEKENDNE